MPQAELKCFPDASLSTRNEEKAQDKIRAKPPQCAVLQTNRMKGWERGELCFFVEDGV